MSSNVVDRDQRRWRAPEVLAERVFVQMNHAVRNEGEDWALDIDLYVGDSCADHEFREVQQVELLERVENKPAAAVPLIAGLATLIVTPFAVYYASVQTTDPAGNPIEPQPSQLGAAGGIGAGVGVGLTLAGIGTIAATKKGAGHHERVLSSRKEDLGPVTQAVPCNWRELDSGSGSLLSGTTRLPFRVEVGRATVVLPAPANAGPGDVGIVWRVDLDGLGRPDVSL